MPAVQRTAGSRLVSFRDSVFRRCGSEVGCDARSDRRWRRHRHIDRLFPRARGAEPIVIEPTGLACAASGKSGGFLALDWCDGTPLQALARRSFALHAELAEELDGERWGYRRLDTFGGFASARAASRHATGSRVDWVAEASPWIASSGQSDDGAGASRRASRRR